MDKKSRFFLSIGLIICSVATIVSLDWYLFWNRPVAGKSTLLLPFSIKKGESIEKVIEKLIDTRLFNRTCYLNYYIAHQEDFEYFRYGDYLINPQDNPKQILEQLAKGKVRYHEFTITPGLTWQKLHRKMKQSGLFEITLNSEEKIKEICKEQGIDSLEGWLAPESYHIARYTTDSAMVKIAVKQQREILQEHFDAQSCPLSLNETLVLASIIERESAHIDEYPLISSTYHNRLNIKMKLQSDPTVRYSQPQLEEIPLKYSHLKIDHPHNTYLYHGLPPTAIAYPSKNAIIASCHPDDTPYLFFIADKSKKYHIFTTNYEDHLNVQKQQRS